MPTTVGFHAHADSNVGLVFYPRVIKGITFDVMFSCSLWVIVGDFFTNYSRIRSICTIVREELPLPSSSLHFSGLFGQEQELKK